ncbi:MAG: LapA family protein [Desulfobulbaceae bacterium]|nr:LapA family protein [Desulfobulbaceae bacterium]
MIFQNRSPVQAHFLFVTVEMPVILLLVLTAALGFILGMLVSFYARPGAREEQ